MSSDKKAGVVFDSSAIHTWKEVHTVAAGLSSDRYESKASRTQLLQKIGKVATDSSTMLSAWAEILPSQNEYFSVICGGLKLIFGVSTSEMV